MSEENKISIKKATLLNAISKYSNVVFMLVANAVLARLLTAEEYGVLAIITVFVTLFHLFSDMGFSAAVIQNKELDQEDISNIFSFTVYLGLGLSVLFVALSFVVAEIYGDRVYIPIGMWLSLSVFFNTINMIPKAQLMREKRFALVAVWNVVVYIGSYTVAIIMAYKGFSYYSLVGQSILAALANFLWSYFTVKIRFKIVFDFSSIKKIYEYSTNIFFYDLLNYFGRNLDNLLTGKFMGSEVLGYYNKAYQLMLYPVHYLTNVITPVLHPILSDYQKDKEYIYTKYLTILKILSMMGVFASVICIFCAKEIVLLLYGPTWVQVIPCIVFLGGSVWFQMITSTCTSIFQSLGESKLRLKSGIVYAVIQIIMIICGVVLKDIRALSAFVATSFVVRFFVEHYYLIHGAFKKSQAQFYIIFLPELIMAAALSGVMFEANRFMYIENNFLSLVAKGCVAFVAYLPLIKLTKQEQHILRLLPKKLCKRK